MAEEQKDQKTPQFDIADAVHKVFLAGVGALAYTGEKSKEIVDQLVEKGTVTVEQGKELNQELTQKAASNVQQVTDDILRDRMAAMTPEQRQKFVEQVKSLADKVDEEAKKVDEKDDDSE